MPTEPGPLRGIAPARGDFGQGDLGSGLRDLLPLVYDGLRPFRPRSVRAHEKPGQTFYTSDFAHEKSENLLDSCSPLARISPRTTHQQKSDRRWRQRAAPGDLRESD